MPNGGQSASKRQQQQQQQQQQELPFQAVACCHTLDQPQSCRASVVEQWHNELQQQQP
jgi:hypothetical protein